jgi:hypothetical protein
MMRIKKKFLLSVFILVCFVFIFFYLNQLVPKDREFHQQQTDFSHDKRFVSKKTDPAKKPRHHFDTPNDNAIINNQIEPDFDDLPSKVLKDDGILPENPEADLDQSCNIDVDVVPNANVQMMDAYREIPFDNVDGGVWKQGEY